MFLMKKLIRLLITMRSIDLIETYIYVYIWNEQSSSKWKRRVVIDAAMLNVALNVAIS